MSWAGMNLQSIITPQITSIVPDSVISLNIYNGDTVDMAGNVSTTYLVYPNLYANVQLEQSQKMIHTAAYDMTKVYKRFYLQSFTLTGLNRNLGTGGDFIQMIDSGLYYKIVEVNYNFKTGWVLVVGVESVSISDNNIVYVLALNQQKTEGLATTPEKDVALALED